MKDRRGKYLILGIIFLVSLVFAYLITNLTINGNITVESNLWDIHFENIQIDENSSYSDNDLVESVINTDSYDKLFLLSATEVYGNTEWDYATNYSSQLDYYKNNLVDGDYSKSFKNYKGSYEIWWLRTPANFGISANYITCYAGSEHGVDGTYTDNHYATLPAFKIW